MAPGPILIFDKSALQSLTVDESVWLDHFFLTNITPIFYVETLADLEKVDPKGRAPEDVVANMADKTPVFHPYPNVFHRTLLIQDLRGHPVAMTGQIMHARGTPKTRSRWRQERPLRGAAGGRHDAAVAGARLQGDRAASCSLLAHDAVGYRFNSKIAWAQRLVPPGQKIASLADAKAFADAFVATAGREVLTFAGQFLEIPDEQWGVIERRFADAGRPALKDFAPYAAFVLTIDLVFYLGMGIRQIGTERPSNRIDVAYLYYLPFCMVFVSGDNLHARLAPLFLRPNQEFVKSADLKAGLKQLNEHYAQHRADIERMGVMTYASEPPADVPTIVTTLWDRLLLKRDRPAGEREPGTTPPSNDELLRRIKHITESEPNEADAAWQGEPDSVVLRHDPLRRGSWRLVPEGAETRGRPTHD